MPTLLLNSYEEAARLLSNAINQDVAHADVMTSHVNATPADIIQNTTKWLQCPKNSKTCHDIEKSKNLIELGPLKDICPDDISDDVILDGIDID